MNEETTLPKIHIYNNNKWFRKSNSESQLSLFFEPYYSKYKKCTKNCMYDSLPIGKPIGRSILEGKSGNLPYIRNLYEKAQRKLAEKRLPKINKSQQKTPFFNVRIKNRDLGEIYSNVFLSRDKINDKNLKIRRYYIDKIPENIRSYRYRETGKRPYDRL